MVELVSSAGTDPPLSNTILPRTAEAGPLVPDAEARNFTIEGDVLYIRIDVLSLPAYFGRSAYAMLSWRR